MVDISKLSKEQLDGLTFWIGNYGPKDLFLEDKLELWLMDQINQQTKTVIANKAIADYEQSEALKLGNISVDSAK